MDASTPPSSPYAYAQYHGLCLDHRLLDESLLPSSLSRSSAQRYWPGCFADYDANSKQNLADDLQEKLITTPECLCLLDMLLMPDDVNGQVVFQEATCLLFTNLKLDLPALQEDHELCMDRLRTRLAHASVRKEISMISRDECSWKETTQLPPTNQDDDRHFVVHAERLTISKETSTYMSELLFFPDDMDTMADRYSHTPSLHKVESPLLVPSSPPCHASVDMSQLKMSNLLPSPCSSNDSWTEELEQAVLTMLDKSFEPATSALGEPHCMNAAQLHDHASDHAPELNISPPGPLRQLRLSSPIVSQRQSASQSSFQTLPSELEDLLPLASLLPDSSNAELVEPDIDMLLKQLAAPAVAMTDQMLSAEHLVEIDTTLKVIIPQVNDDTSHAYQEELQNGTLRQACLHLVPTAERRHKGLSSIERSLCWTPFPRHMSIVDMIEMLPHQERYQFTLVESAPELDVAANMCNHIAAHTTSISQDDYLEPMRVHSEMDESPSYSSPPHTQATPDTTDYALTREPCGRLPAKLNESGLQALLLKRKSALDSSHESSDTQLVRASKKRAIAQPASSAPIPTILTEGTDLLQAALAGFLSAQGHRRPQNLVPLVRHHSKGVQEEFKDHASQPHQSVLESPVLTLEPLPPDRQVIISSEMMAQRPLVSMLQEKWPSLTIIERDNGHGSTVEHSEADLTISEGEGIVLTTMQRLRQKALPSQTGGNSFRRRLQRSLCLYTRLYILVHQEASSDTASPQPLAGRDCELLSELTAWVCSLNHSTSIIYVAGGEPELCAWICNLIKSVRLHARFRLAEEESVWERWLRVAGLNAFAAQALLVGLKSSSSSSSPATFTMSASHTPSPQLATLHGLARLAGASRSALTALLKDAVPDFAARCQLNNVFDNAWFVTVKPSVR